MMSKRGCFISFDIDDDYNGQDEPRARDGWILGGVSVVFGGIVILCFSVFLRSLFGW